ncbi:helix-turn-helix domain-containing protein [Actinocorallia sp. A-T 12471]|uniref:TetR/AcrR family transcriptional regulator n=1 Tax=Actinocorallia sp. A-T 12471 TaxID=3089813 RepID=UPI0029D31D28|nr:helix-turn-helix domain-containing protein [Actinocorallia sp. A-T 12471]MDX6740639.1 helix-turn-helix domain-containing protein [Actinocorallia sp. A-T 12471]
MTDKRALGVRERNRLSILNAAREVLEADPEASMDDIAAVAGMVRRTLYGHFPTRQDLVGELVRAGAREFVADLGEVDVTARDPAEEMAALVLRTWGAADRFAKVIALARRGADGTLLAEMEPFNAVVARLIAHGQRHGVFTNDLAPHMLARVLESGALAFLAARSDGSWDGDAADVARTHLLLLGVPVAQARAAVRTATARERSSDEI